MRRNSAVQHLNDKLQHAYDERSQAEKKIDLARALIGHELAHHQPTSFSLDLSSIATDDLRAGLAERVNEGRRVCCTICRTPWPCQQIAVLRQIRDVLYGDTEDIIPPRGRPAEYPALIL